MNNSDNILLFAAPVFLVCIAAEAIIAGKEYWNHHKKNDIKTSLGIGIGFLIISAATKGALVGCYLYLNNWKIFSLPQNAWWVWVLCFIADDITYYWFHRLSHRVRFFWVSHMVHHSSENYFYGAALRQTWTGNAAGVFLIWGWMPLIGFDAHMVLMIKSISIIYQFWIHTELIKKLPAWIEAVFNTPSHHRVHHSSDEEYLDKNYGAILIIWDRLFGTFTEEKRTPKYGTVKKVHSSNPFQIVAFEWRHLLADIKKSNSIFSIFPLLLKPPGRQSSKPGAAAEETNSGIHSSLKK